MSKRRSCFLLFALAGFALPASVAAQTRSAVTATELETAVTVRPTGARESLRGLLATEQAQSAADRFGVSASELATRVSTLDQASIDLIARRAGLQEDGLAGGSNIVISTTAVIIALLLLILLVD